MADFLIIGAGINGLLVARELSQAGASVILLEKSVCCQEASWAGGGIVSPLYPWRYSQAVTALASWAQDFYPGLARRLYDSTGIDPELEASGLLMLDANDEPQALSWAGNEGRAMEPMSADILYHQEPNLGPGFRRGLWMPEVANVRNPRLGKALVEALRSRPDVAMHEHCAVLSFERDKGRVTGVVARQEGRTHRFRAGKFILCAGAWSGLLAEGLGLSLPVVPVKGQMLLYRFPAPPIRSILLTARRYLIPRRDGHLLAGSTLEYRGFDKTPSGEAQASLHASAQRLLPELKELKPIGHWAGLRPGAPEGIPYIGPLPDLENLHINAGQFRNGLVLAPASARLAADLLLERHPFLDPSPYLPARRMN